MERIPEDRNAVVGPWAKEKLATLESYLDYYTTRLKNQSQWQKIYVDAFAGGGRAAVRRRPAETSRPARLWEEEPQPEETEFVEGSPRRALSLRHPFDSYIFIDADPTRVAMLRKLKEEHTGPSRISVREGTADDQIAWVLSHKPTPAKHRGVAFLDPFGAHLEWRSVQALAQTRVFEVIINFPFHMCLNRLMTKDADIRSTWRAQLDAFLPSGWYEQAYERVSLLLGEETQKRSDTAQRVLTWYRERLGEAFGFVSEPRLIRNTKGAPLYFLLWAGPNAAGLKGADYIMKMGEQIPAATTQSQGD